jgi:hypothetical protein
VKIRHLNNYFGLDKYTPCVVVRRDPGASPPLPLPLAEADRNDENLRTTDVAPPAVPLQDWGDDDHRRPGLAPCIMILTD